MEGVYKKHLKDGSVRYIERLARARRQAENETFSPQERRSPLPRQDDR